MMLYWGSTTVICVFLLLSAGSYLLHQSTIDGVRDLGFPDFFRVQLAVLKLAAVITLALPIVPVQVKEWAHAGVALFLITAIVAHYAHGDPIWLNVLNGALLLILAVSNMYLPR